MTGNISKLTFSVLLSAVLAGCLQRQDEPAAPILFSIDGGLDAELTKSVITTDNLASNYVKVYATKGIAAITDETTATITKGTAYWNYSGGTTWDDGKAYSFRGYAYNTTGFSNISANGLTFKVINSSNNAANTYDYAMSHEVEIPAEVSGSHPVVGLEFDHILPAIEVYVTKSPAMKDVQITRMTLDGLFTAATMTYSPVHDVWDEDYVNTRNSGYNITNKTVGTSRNATEATLSFISVPQGFNQDTKLTVNYKVDESMTSTVNYVNHSHIFKLSDYSEGIMVGQRLVFHVNIDTGIHLNATIAKWKPVDFIEGTVLPPIE